MEVTAAQKSALETTDATWERPPQSIIDLAEQDPYCKFNEDTGFFELNGLTDITYKEFMEIYDAGAISSVHAEEFYQKRNIRTNLNMRICPNTEHVTLTRFIYQCPKLEVLSLRERYNKYIILSNPSGLSYIQGAPKLRAVLGVLNVMHVSAGNSYKVAYEVPNLESIKLYGIAVNFSLGHLPKLDYESVRYMIEKALNTTTITITFHPNVYAKLTGDETSDAYNNLSEEEKIQWLSLIEIAESKNIQFATT